MIYWRLSFHCIFVEVHPSTTFPCVDVTPETIIIIITTISNNNTNNSNNINNNNKNNSNNNNNAITTTTTTIIIQYLFMKVSLKIFFSFYHNYNLNTCVQTSHRVSVDLCTVNIYYRPAGEIN